MAAVQHIKQNRMIHRTAILEGSVACLCVTYTALGCRAGLCKTTSCYWMWGAGKTATQRYHNQQYSPTPSAICQCTFLHQLPFSKLHLLFFSFICIHHNLGRHTATRSSIRTRVHCKDPIPAAPDTCSPSFILSVRLYVYCRTSPGESGTKWLTRSIYSARS